VFHADPWRLARLTTVALVVLAMSGAAPDPAHGNAVSAQSRADALPLVASRLARGAPLRIVAFGSSSTEGVGASSKAASYPSRLEQALSAGLPEPVVVLNRGIGGEDADDMALRLPAILAEKPDLVIWQTGSNDPLRDVPLARFIASTRAGVTAIRAAGVDVMLMEPQLCDRLQSTAGADRYRLALRQIGAEMGVPVIRRFDLMRAWLDRGLITRAALMAGDGLHMADAGYAMLATEVAREIRAAAR
jgi:lysophospholipase L1-like esterase